MNEAKPLHGEERNRRVEAKVSTAEFEFADTGEPFEVSYVSSEETVVERFCSTCQEWKESRGVLGKLLGCPDCREDWRTGAR